MKTPEQMAEEYAEFGTQGVPDSIRKQQIMAKDRMAFLAGYQAAKDQQADTNKVITADYVETAINDAKELIAKYELEGDKDMLIKALVAAYCSGVDAVDGYLRNSLSAYRNSVKRLQWISVKKSEPSDETWVLGTNGRDIECVFKHFTDCYSMTTITHWMPLPEAPKEE